MASRSGSQSNGERIGPVIIQALPEPRDGQVEAWAGRMHWSPDGTRLAIEAGNGQRGKKTSIDTYLVAIDGSAAVVLRDARSVTWSPDGTELAFVHRTGPVNDPDDPPGTPATIEVVGADGADRRQVAVPSGDSDGSYMLWATNWHYATPGGRALHVTAVSRSDWGPNQRLAFARFDNVD